MITCTSQSSKIILEQYVSKAILLATRPTWDRIFDAMNTCKYNQAVSMTMKFNDPLNCFTEIPKSLAFNSATYQ